MRCTMVQQRAKQILFWPGINQDIERTVKKCRVCEENQKSNVKEPMILREFPDLPFEKVASDILDYGGQSYIVIIDYFSKWLEVVKLERKTSQAVITAMKMVFSSHGIPLEVYADNMPYNSKECQDFAKTWNFRFITSSPNYPKSNGMAERAVQIAKNMLRKCTDLNLALIEYRNTPVTGTEKSPAQLLTGRCLRTKLPVAKSLSIPTPVDYEEEKRKLETKRVMYKNYYDRSATNRQDFKERDNIVVQEGRKWEPAIISHKVDTPRSYIVQKENGRFVRRNSSHIRSSLGKCEIGQDLTNYENNSNLTDDNNGSDQMQAGTQSCSQNIDPGPRKSTRVIKQPKRLDDYNLHF